MKIVKRPLAIILAVLMVLSSFSVAFAAIGDGQQRTLRTWTEFLRYDGDNWVETVKVRRGEYIKARVYLQTDFLAGNGAYYFFYDKSFMTPSVTNTGDPVTKPFHNYAGNDYYTIGYQDDPAIERFAEFLYDEVPGTLIGLTNHFVNHGLISQDDADNYGQIWAFTFDGIVNYLEGDYWCHEFYFKVRDDAQANQVGHLFTPHTTRMAHNYYMATNATDQVKVTDPTAEGERYPLFDASRYISSFQYEFEIETFVPQSWNTLATQQGETNQEILQNTNIAYNNNTETDVAPYVTLGDPEDVDWNITGDDVYSNDPNNIMHNVPFGTEYDTIAPDMSGYTPPFGYTFGSWNTSANGIMDDNGNQQVPIGGGTVTGTLNPRNVNVTFVPPAAFPYNDPDNGGLKWAGLPFFQAGQPQTQTVTYGQSITENPTWGGLQTVAPGYYLKGWTALDVNSSSYTPSDTDPIYYKNDGENYPATQEALQGEIFENGGVLSVYLIPVILPIPPYNPTITWVDNETQNVLETQTNYPAATPIVVPGTIVIPERTGYTYNWYRDPADPTTKIVNGNFGNAINDETFYGVYDVNSYNLNWEVEGTVIDTDTVDYGTPNLESYAPQVGNRVGYTFSWGQIPPTMPANDVTIVGTYTINNYDIEYTINTPTGQTTGTINDVDYNTKLTGEGGTLTPLAQDIEGYSFAWAPTVPEYMPAHDLTGTNAVVGTYTVNSYNANYYLDAAKQNLHDTTVNDYGSAITTPADPTSAVYPAGKYFTGWEDVNGDAPADYPNGMPANDVDFTAVWADDSYTFSFDPANGDAATNVTRAYSDFVLGADVDEPTRTGYDFDGWYDGTTPITDTSTVGDYADGATVTITAHWQIKQYTITFDTDGGNAIDPITQDYGTTITPPADPTKEGHTFAEWDTQIPGTMPANDMTITALWNVNQYPAVFSVNGGEWADQTTDDITVDTNFGEVPVPPAAPTRAGYEFTEWSPALAVMTTAGANYAAQWKGDTYTFSFDPANGDAASEVDRSFGDPVLGTDVTEPTRTGYTFDYWEYSDGTQITATSTVGDYADGETVNITAHWTRNQYVVTFVAGANGSLNGAGPHTANVNHGDTLTAAQIPGFTPDPGYQFAAWVGSNGENINTAIVAPITFTATFEVETLDARFWLDINDIVPYETTQNDFGAEIEVPADPTDAPDGKYFDGWQDANGNAPEDYTNGMPADDVDFYAVWADDSYTFSFDPANGDAATNVTREYGDAVLGADVTEPTRTGYDFDGWYDGTTLITDASTVGDYANGATVTITAHWQIKQYTITFDTDGGNAIAPITQDYGTTITPPADPTKEGHTFAEWDTQIPGTMPATNMTITALWNVNQYPAVFSVNGGEWADQTTDDITVDTNFGETPVPPVAPTRAGYEFTEWSPALAVMTTAGANYAAQWDADSYTFSFDPANGDAATNVTREYGDAVLGADVTEPTRTGYTFDGWYDGTTLITDTSTVGDYADGATINIEAHWRANEYTITFDMNGADSAQIDPITQDYGTAITQPAGPTREGYDFTGWEPEVPATMPAGDLEVVAQWQVKQYTITFDMNGADSALIDPITQDYGTDITPPADPTYTGFVFQGWQPEVPATMPAGDLEVVAQWKADEYIFTFNPANGVDNPFSVGRTYNDLVLGIDVTEPSRAGYTFDGWYDGTTLITGASTVADYEDGATINIEAHWRANEYTITFNMNGADSAQIDPITQDYGTDITPPADPTREGYTFTGWQPGVPATMPAGDLEVVAQWQINQHTITFDSAGGTPVASITQDYGTAITPPADPTRDYHTFEGWDTQIPTTMPDEDMTITATWRHFTTVTFMVDAAVMEEKNVSQGDQITYTGAAIVPPAGSSFKGWTTTPGGEAAALPVAGTDDTATYYAVFAPTGDIELTFVPGNGEPNIVVDRTYGDFILGPDVQDPTRTGYTFKGWEDSNGVLVGPTDTVDSTDPATYTARWAARNYAVNYFVNGVNVAGNTAQYGSSYTVLEWSTAEYEVTQWTDENNINYTPGDSFVYTQTGSLNLNATIEYNTCNVTFVVDGTTIATATVNYGGTLEANQIPEDPTKTGYTFAGWDGNTEATIVEDTTFTALWNAEERTITCYIKQIDGNGDIISDTQLLETIPVSYGDTIETPAEPLIDHYNFLRFEFADGTEVLGTETVTENVTIYAVLQIESVTVTFVAGANGTLVGGSPQSINVDYGTTLTAAQIPAYTPDQGYQFAAWTGGDINAAIVADTTFTATFEVETLDARFWLNAGDTTPYETTQNDFGAEIEVPADPTDAPDGKYFDGWEDVNGDAPEDYTNGMPANDVDFYAVWADDAYTFSFDPANGDAATNVTRAYGDFVLGADVTEPTRTGYDFDGWYDGTTLIAAGDTVADYENGATVTITAHWRAKEYTITFDSAGGSAVDPITAEYGAAITQPADPTREGYDFTGWEPEVPTTMPAEDMTVVAQWQIRSWTATFEPNGGTWFDGETTQKTTTFNYGDPVEAPQTLTREGYDLTGWNPALGSMPDHDQTYTAQWQEATYNANFWLDASDPTPYETTYNDFGAEIEVPADPTDAPEGKWFVCWEDSNGDTPDSYTMPANDVDFYAVWGDDLYTFSFDPANGDPATEVDRSYGDEILGADVSTPTRPGYTFLGWFDANDNLIQAGDTVADYEDGETVYITAKWRDDTAIVKLVAKDATSTAMVERDGVVETYNDLTSSPVPHGVTETRATDETTYTYDNGITQDYDEWYVYGLKLRLKAGELADYISVTGGGYYEVYANDTATVPATDTTTVGTGAVIKVYDSADNFVEQFYIVIYGDLDGRANVNNAEAVMVDNEINQRTNWKTIGYMFRAADLDQAGNINNADAVLFSSVINKIRVIDQVTGRVVV